MELCNNALQIQKYLISAFLSGGENVVDATLGNGRDALTLCSLTNGMLFGFDIQKEAVGRSERLLVEHGVDMSRVRLFCDDHSRMEEYLSCPVSLILFNLGYLPGGDKQVTTTVDSTMKAVGRALKLVEAGGRVMITAYPGHPQGFEEREALADWTSRLDQKTYNCVSVRFPNQKGAPPELFCIEKRSLQNE